MSNNFKSIEKKLTSNGWQLVRISGSHHQYKNIKKSRKTNRTISSEIALFAFMLFYFLTQRNFIDQMTSCRHRFVFRQ